MTRLCVPILVRSLEQARRDALIAIEHGAEIIELRIDALHADSGESAFNEDTLRYETAGLVHLINDLRDQAIRVIVTNRAGDEGGQTEADDQTRFTRLAEIIHEAHAWVDLEWRPMSRAGGWPMAFLELASEQPADIRFFVSVHDFQSRPSDLLNLFAEMSLSRAEFVKVVWRARSIRDNIEAFELLREAAKPSIVLCMGEAGQPSRILAKKFGAYLTFASLNDAKATADGQIPIEILKRRYRWDAIGRATKVYGVVGHPVSHSRSPHVHNAAFDAVDHDGVYLPLLVQPGYESFKAFMETWLGFVPLDLSGLSITLPHKENALRYAREVGATIDPLAEQVGAVNTFAITRDAEKGLRLRATNTDHDAILQTALDVLGAKSEALRGMSIGIIGAGGTGRTATAAFANVGATVTVYNRTRARADELAGDFPAGNVGSASLGEMRSARHRIWINTTSVGMSPDLDADVFGEVLPSLDSETLVIDTIYNPVETRLLRRAREAGARVVNGAPMFIAQAAAQLELWTGQPAPLDEMRAAMDAAE